MELFQPPRISPPNTECGLGAPRTFGAVAVMKSDDDQLPTSAADFFLLAQLAAGQARATRHPKTARVLLRMARAYLERAAALGWKMPVDGVDSLLSQVRHRD
jgi:hypothetical protein